MITILTKARKQAADIIKAESSGGLPAAKRRSKKSHKSKRSPKSRLIP